MSRETMVMYYKEPEHTGYWPKLGDLEEFSVTLANGMKVDGSVHEGVLQLDVHTPALGGETKYVIQIISCSGTRQTESTFSIVG